MARNLLDSLSEERSSATSVHASVATVTTVYADNTVGVSVAGSATLRVPCAKTYPLASRAVGDVVLVLKFGATWVVIAEFGVA